MGIDVNGELVGMGFGRNRESMGFPGGSRVGMLGQIQTQQNRE